jgi:hypothetical protein
MLWNAFDLTTGVSPLAKALHRAWAYHEHCSEAVHPAIALFEKSNDHHKMERENHYTPLFELQCTSTTSLFLSN